jgi:hypothetical protein
MPILILSILSSIEVSWETRGDRNRAEMMDIESDDPQQYL